LNCRYDGGSKLCEKVLLLVAEGRAVPVCPEQMGGLPTPRLPAERKGERVIRSDGADVTAEFVRGAEEALNLGKLVGAKKAILKTKSPSCGCGFIYDGSFTHTLVPGGGVFANLCKMNGIEVRTDEEI
jgi:uncharacterized protein YbbK (DUF523 family)